MNPMKINYKKVREGAQAPTRGSDKAAGYDLHALTILDGKESEITIWPGTNELIHTGLAIETPEDHFGGIFPRSGLSTKEGLRLANCVAVIDEDYRGEWLIPIYNDSNSPKTIKNGERIAQVVFIKRTEVVFNEVDELTDTQRGSGGFGSSGTH